EGLQPGHQVAAPDAEFAVGEFDASGCAAELAPAVEGAAGDATQHGEHFGHGEELIIACHRASPPRGAGTGSEEPTRAATRASPEDTPRPAYSHRAITRTLSSSKSGSRPVVISSARA